MKKRKWTIATAESASGGYVSHLLTKIPGSSLVFKGGVVAYSLGAKHKFFHIPWTLLKKTKGVSAEVCRLLAVNVRSSFTTDVGISLVGFAGPGARKGISPGTVYLGITDGKKAIVKKYVFKGSRTQVQQKASKELITLTYQYLISLP